MIQSQQPKVSIIIPVRNLENYIRKSLDTVVMQTLEDIEIICIDDASTDKSLEIIEFFASKDERIKILKHQEAKGQSTARNLAIDIASGEYVCFVDGDDWVEKSIVEKMYNNAKKNDSDMVMCGANVYDEQALSTDFENAYYNLSIFSEKFNDKPFSHMNCPEIMLDLNVAIWAKLYKKDFLIQNQVRFADGYIYEDLLYFYQIYLKAKKVSLVRENLYFYRINRSGSTMQNVKSKILDRPEMVIKTFELFKNQLYFGELKFKLIDWLISDLFHRYTLVSPEYRKEFFFRMKKIFLSLDLSGIDIKALEYIYYYEEFIAVNKYSFEECCDKFFETHYRAKKNLKEKLYAQQLFYEDKENYQTIYEKEIDRLKEWYENEITYRLNKQKQSYEQELESRLLSQQEFYNEELKLKLIQKENLLKEENAQAILNIKEEVEQEFKQKFIQKAVEIEQEYDKLKESYKRELEQKNVELHNQSLRYKNEMESKLNSQQSWLEQDFARIKKEVDDWHNNHLRENLENQKNHYENQINEMDFDRENQLKEQKEHYENELINLKSYFNSELESQRSYYEQKSNEQKRKFDKDTKYLKTLIKILNKAKNFKSKVRKKLQGKTEQKTVQPMQENNIPKVSVILPIYNVDKYLRQSLDSLINQTLKEIEIICVNDGSTDGCFDILEEYIKKDKRIKVIHKKNAGTGAARNDGLKIATGECIAFVDPDDWVKENMFERLYCLMQEKDVDITMCTPAGFDEQNQVETDFPYFVDSNFKKELENRVFSWREISPFSYPMCVWNKLYKKELFDKHNIEFAEGLDFEDHKVIFKSLLTAGKIFFVREKLYVYRFNRVGSILTDNNRRLIDHIEIFNIVENILIETQSMQSLRMEFVRYKVHNLLYYYNMINEEHKSEYYSKMIQSIVDTKLSQKESGIMQNEYPELVNIMDSIKYSEEASI